MTFLNIILSHFLYIRKHTKSQYDLLNLGDVQRQSQDVRSDLKRNVDGIWEWKGWQCPRNVHTKDSWRIFHLCRTCHRCTSMTLPSEGETMINDMLQNQRQNMLILEMNAQGRAVVSMFMEERRRQRQELFVRDCKRIVHSRRKILLWTWSTEEKQGKSKMKKSAPLGQLRSKSMCQKVGKTSLTKRGSTSMCELQKRIVFQGSKGKIVDIPSWLKTIKLWSIPDGNGLSTRPPAKSRSIWKSVQFNKGRRKIIWKVTATITFIWCDKQLEGAKIHGCSYESSGYQGARGENWKVSAR